MNPGGEAADTLVKMYLNGADMMIRLSGALLKNLLAITMALARENKKVSGRINLAKMLRETRDLRTFTMTPAQYKAFKKLAKKQGILFAAVTDKDGKGKLVDVILPATELDRANMLFERILYDPNLGPDSPEPPQSEKEHWWQRVFHRREKERERDATPPQEHAPLLLGDGMKREPENPTRPVPEALPEYREEHNTDSSMEHPGPEVILPTVIHLGVPMPEGETRTEEAESPTEQLPPGEELRIEGAQSEMLLPEQRVYDGPPRENGAAQPEMVQNDAPPSQPALPDTSVKSPSPNRGADTRTTRESSERPSVLKKLEGYREEIERKKGPAPERGKETGRGGRKDTKPRTPVKTAKAPKKPVR